MRTHRLFAAAALLSFLGLGAPARLRAQPASPPARLAKVHRILFLGDSITYAGYYVEDIDAYLVTRFPENRFELLNLGLSSETVSGLTEAGHAGGKYSRPDLHERLARVLAKTKPDLVFACYGMNDGIYQPFDQERFAKFQAGLQWLHEQAAAAGIPIVHLTPTVFDAVAAKGRTVSTGAMGFSRPFEDYDSVLARYSEWLLAQRSKGWEVVDIHGRMTGWLAAHRKQDGQFQFTKDGVHPDEAGHWVIAKEVLRFLGAKDVDGAETAVAMLPAQRGNEFLKLIRKRDTLLRDAWLTETGHTRPGVTPGLPIAQAQAGAEELDREIHKP